ncbi:MAG: putative sugar O-methyltransferase, partial [Arenimonas sp.]
VDELSGEGLAGFRSMPGPLDYFVPTYGFPAYGSHPGRFDPVRESLAALQLEDGRTGALLERLLSGEAQAESDFRVLQAGDRVDAAPYLSSFSESTIGRPLEQFSFEGRRFSRSSLNYLLGLAFLKRHCDTSAIRTVLEIGAGFGSLGEVLLADPRNECFYADVDIPPTLHAATYYLKSVLGSEAVFDYEDAKRSPAIDLRTLARTHRAATLATWQLPRISGQVDLFVNFISFQEMEPAVVRNYLQHADRLQSRLVLLRNLREGKAKARDADDVGRVAEPVLGSMYDGFLGNYRLLATSTMPFGYRTVDGFHSQLRLYERV